MDKTLRITERFKLLHPLQVRDFALLWSGMTVSLLGDGIMLVALPWQVYQLRNDPAALSVVGLAWTLPLALVVLFGGALSDRWSRKKIMVAADVVRGVAMMSIGSLSISGHLRLWHMIVFVALYGLGEGLFMPAFTAVVPDIVPRDLLVQANSLGEVVQPLAMRFVGPALGGLIVASIGVGQAFVIDAVTFVVSAIFIARLKPRPLARDDVASTVREIADGFRYVASQTWLWATMVAAFLSMLVFWGPYEVLVPFVIKNRYLGGAGDLGMVFAMGGIGSIAASLRLAQRDLPRRHVSFMYITWALSFLGVAAYGVFDRTWQAMIASFIVGVLASSGSIVWGTLMQRLVPTALLGRVASLDWFMVTAAMPVSFALTGPVAAHFGEAPTLVVAGILGFAVHISFLALPGLTRVEQSQSPAVAPARML